MDREFTITDVVFAAFLHCHTKAYLLHTGEELKPNDLSRQEWNITTKYKHSAGARLQSTFPTASDDDGLVSLSRLPPKRTLAVLNPLIVSSHRRAQPDALLCIKKGDSPVTYVPVRFSRRAKITTNDRLMLTFDALAIADCKGVSPEIGKMVYGPQYAMATVSLSRSQQTVRAHQKQLVSLLSSPDSPPLVLNKHCAQCDFKARCSRIAKETDDLSLLATMTPKARRMYNNKGIFTVNQLSYTFRPRKHRKIKCSAPQKHEYGLKALAIRKNLVHILGDPHLSIIPERTVYLDVEGIPEQVLLFSWN